MWLSSWYAISPRNALRRIPRVEARPAAKTTLLRTIARLEEPTEGEVLIGGNIVPAR
jgi:ABC-type histidine transport system ATPase subunit